MSKRGQGSFEYVLALAGILLIVLVVSLILRNTVSSTGKDVNQSFLAHSESVDFADWWVSSNGVSGASAGFKATRLGGTTAVVAANSPLYFVNDDGASHFYKVFDSSDSLVGSGTVASLSGAAQQFPGDGTYSFSWDDGQNNTATVGSPTPTPSPTPDPGTPITVCTDISQPGYYYLANDISGIASWCITVSTSNVVLDGAGKQLSCSVQVNGVIYVESPGAAYTNVTIHNFRTSQCYNAIYLFVPTSGINVSNNQLVYNGANTAQILLWSNNVGGVFEANTITHLNPALGAGIRDYGLANTGNLYKNNRILDTGQALRLQSSSNTVQNNIACGGTGTGINTVAGNSGSANACSSSTGPVTCACACPGPC